MVAAVFSTMDPASMEDDVASLQSRGVAVPDLASREVVDLFLASREVVVLFLANLDSILRLLTADSLVLGPSCFVVEVAVETVATYLSVPLEETTLSELLLVVSE